MPTHEDVRPMPRKALFAALSPPTSLNPTAEALIAGLGAFLVIFLLAELSSSLGHLLLIAPFGASCVLVFALPRTPVAQPKNVIGGHVVATFVGLIASYLLGATPLGFAFGVGLAISAMSLTSTLHPPAGADPIVVITLGASWSFLFVPVLLGAILITGFGVAYHLKISGKTYPVAAVPKRRRVTLPVTASDSPQLPARFA